MVWFWNSYQVPAEFRPSAELCELGIRAWWHLRGEPAKAERVRLAREVLGIRS